MIRRLHQQGHRQQYAPSKAPRAPTTLWLAAKPSAASHASFATHPHCQRAPAQRVASVGNNNISHALSERTEGTNEIHADSSIAMLVQRAKGLRHQSSFSAQVSGSITVQLLHLLAKDWPLPDTDSPGDDGAAAAELAQLEAAAAAADAAIAAAQQAAAVVAAFVAAAKEATQVSDAASSAGSALTHATSTAAETASAVAVALEVAVAAAGKAAQRALAAKSRNAQASAQQQAATAGPLHVQQGVTESNTADRTTAQDLMAADSLLQQCLISLLHNSCSASSDRQSTLNSGDRISNNGTRDLYITAALLALAEIQSRLPGATGCLKLAPVTEAALAQEGTTAQPWAALLEGGIEGQLGRRRKARELLQTLQSAEPAEGGGAGEGAEWLAERPATGFDGGNVSLAASGQQTQTQLALPLVEGMAKPPGPVAELSLQAPVEPAQPYSGNSMQELGQGHQQTAATGTWPEANLLPHEQQVQQEQAQQQTQKEQENQQQDDEQKQEQESAQPDEPQKRTLVRNHTVAYHNGYRWVTRQPQAEETAQGQKAKQTSVDPEVLTGLEDLSEAATRLPTSAALSSEAAASTDSTQSLLVDSSTAGMSNDSRLSTGLGVAASVQTFIQGIYRSKYKLPADAPSAAEIRREEPRCDVEKLRIFQIHDDPQMELGIEQIKLFRQAHSAEQWQQLLDRACPECPGWLRRPTEDREDLYARAAAAPDLPAAVLLAQEVHAQQQQHDLQLLDQLLVWTHEKETVDHLIFGSFLNFELGLGLPIIKERQSRVAAASSEIARLRNRVVFEDYVLRWSQWIPSRSSYVLNAVLQRHLQHGSGSSSSASGEILRYILDQLPHWILKLHFRPSPATCRLLASSIGSRHLLAAVPTGQQLNTDGRDAVLEFVTAMAATALMDPEGCSMSPDDVCGWLRRQIDCMDDSHVTYGTDGSTVLMAADNHAAAGSSDGGAAFAFDPFTDHLGILVGSRTVHMPDETERRLMELLTIGRSSEVITTLVKVCLHRVQRRFEVMAGREGDARLAMFSQGMQLLRHTVRTMQHVGPDDLPTLLRRCLEVAGALLPKAPEAFLQVMRQMMDDVASSGVRAAHSPATKADGRELSATPLEELLFDAHSPDSKAEVGGKEPYATALEGRISIAVHEQLELHRARRTDQQAAAQTALSNDLKDAAELAPLQVAASLLQLPLTFAGFLPSMHVCESVLQMAVQDGHDSLALQMLTTLFSAGVIPPNRTLSLCTLSCFVTNTPAVTADPDRLNLSSLMKAAASLDSQHRTLLLQRLLEASAAERSSDWARAAALEAPPECFTPALASNLVKTFIEPAVSSGEGAEPTATQHQPHTSEGGIDAAVMAVQALWPSGSLSDMSPTARQIFSSWLLQRPAGARSAATVTTRTSNTGTEVDSNSLPLSLALGVWRRAEVAQQLLLQHASDLTPRDLHFVITLVAEKRWVGLGRSILQCLDTLPKARQVLIRGGKTFTLASILKNDAVRGETSSLGGQPGSLSLLVGFLEECVVGAAEGRGKAVPQGATRAAFSRSQWRELLTPLLNVSDSTGSQEAAEAAAAVVHMVQAATLVGLTPDEVESKDQLMGKLARMLRQAQEGARMVTDTSEESDINDMSPLARMSWVVKECLLVRGSLRQSASLELAQRLLRGLSSQGWGLKPEGAEALPFGATMADAPAGSGSGLVPQKVSQQAAALGVDLLLWMASSPVIRGSVKVDKSGAGAEAQNLPWLPELVSDLCVHLAASGDGWARKIAGNVQNLAFIGQACADHGAHAPLLSLLTAALANKPPLALDSWPTAEVAQLLLQHASNLTPRDLQLVVTLVAERQWTGLGRSILQCLDTLPEARQKLHQDGKAFTLACILTNDAAVREVSAVGGQPGSLSLLLGFLEECVVGAAEGRGRAVPQGTTRVALSRSQWRELLSSLLNISDNTGSQEAAEAAAVMVNMVQAATLLGLTPDGARTVQQQSVSDDASPFARMSWVVQECLLVRGSLRQPVTLDLAQRLLREFSSQGWGMRREGTSALSDGAAMADVPAGSEHTSQRSAALGVDLLLWMAGSPAIRGSIGSSAKVDKSGAGLEAQNLAWLPELVSDLCVQLAASGDSWITKLAGNAQTVMFIGQACADHGAHGPLLSLMTAAVTNKSIGNKVPSDLLITAVEAAADLGMWRAGSALLEHLNLDLKSWRSQQGLARCHEAMTLLSPAQVQAVLRILVQDASAYAIEGPCNNARALSAVCSFCEEQLSGAEGGERRALLHLLLSGRQAAAAAASEFSAEQSGRSDSPVAQELDPEWHCQQAERLFRQEAAGVAGVAGLAGAAGARQTPTLPSSDADALLQLMGVFGAAQRPVYAVRLGLEVASGLMEVAPSPSGCCDLSVVASAMSISTQCGYCEGAVVLLEELLVARGEVSDTHIMAQAVEAAAGAIDSDELAQRIAAAVGEEGYFAMDDICSGSDSSGEGMETGGPGSVVVKADPAWLGKQRTLSAQQRQQKWALLLQRWVAGMQTTPEPTAPVTQLQPSWSPETPIFTAPEMLKGAPQEQESSVEPGLRYIVALCGGKEFKASDRRLLRERYPHDELQWFGDSQSVGQGNRSEEGLIRKVKSGRVRLVLILAQSTHPVASSKVKDTCRTHGIKCLVIPGNLKASMHILV